MCGGLILLPKQLTVAQVDEYFHRDERSIRRWIAEGKFPQAYKEGIDMARKGDGLYLRGSTWYLDCRIDGARHVVKLGKGISRTVAGELATVKRAAILKGEAGIGKKRKVQVGWTIISSDIQALIHQSRRCNEVRPLRTPSIFHFPDASESFHITPWLTLPCIYFLVDHADAVLYVGQSTNVLARIASHLKKIPGVSRIFIKSCIREELDGTELHFIKKYRPPHNIVLTTGQRLR